MVAQPLVHSVIDRNADMWEETQQNSMKCATQVLEIYSIEKDAVAHVKEFGKKYNLTRQCIVEKNFGSYVTHETTLSTSTWAKWPFFCSNLVKSMDCTAHPVVHPKIKLQPKPQTPETQIVSLA